MKKKRILILVLTFCMLATVSVFTYAGTIKEQDEVLKQLANKAIDISGINFTKEYTVFDYLKKEKGEEYYQKLEEKEKENKWYYAEPKDEKEKQLFDKLKQQEEIGKNALALKDKITESNDEDKKTYQDQYKKSMEEYIKISEEVKNLMDEAGILE